MESVNSEKLTITDQMQLYFDTHRTLIKIISLIILTALTITVEIAVGGFNTPGEFLQREDIYYVWLEGQKINNGINPYEEILEGDLIRNDKYATYLPFFYLLAALFQKMGFVTFHEWIYFFRVVSAIFFLLITYILFLKCFERSYILSIFVSLYWLFNRWTIIVLFVVNIDFIPLFFLLVSLINFKDRRNLSLYSLGLSLAMKHMAIFLIPVYLLMIQKEDRATNIKKYLTGLTKILLIPLVLAAPFIYWNARAFFYSMIFSGTRFPVAGFDEYFDALPEDHLLTYGVLNRVFMVLIMCLVYLLFYLSKIEKFTASFLIIITFIEFNLVLFDQYRVWRIALLPLMFLELNQISIKNVNEKG
ncbi:MAG: hypothetical protein GPJ54_03985 [Candidatus Heimdallarchaeota archaeon]|nr:hypothetical protein [Candidatus Heimdallarchaeota archaeon]